MTANDMLELLLFGVLGLAVGGLHFALLWRAVAARTAAEPRPSGWPWHVLRLLLTVALLVLAARCGALPLLAATAGFGLARALVVRRVARET